MYNNSAVMNHHSGRAFAAQNEAHRNVNDININQILTLLAENNFNSIHMLEITKSTPEQFRLQVARELSQATVVRFNNETLHFSMGDLPDICRNDVRCNNKLCDRLHVCKQFLLGRCHENCYANHDVFHRRNYAILRKSGLQHCFVGLIHHLYRSSHRPVGLRPQLCTFYSKGSCTKTDCPFLHLCHHHIINEDCRYGEGCRHGHNVFTQHNSKILENFGVNAQTPFIEELLRKWHQTDDSSLKLCKFYTKGSCRNSIQCGYLHLCPDYVSGRCSRAETCTMSHDVLNNGNRTVLTRLKVDVSKPILEIEKEIRGACGRIKDQTIADTELTNGRITPDSTSDHRQYKEICMHHLGKACRYGPKCPRKHATTTYQWQVMLRGQDKGDWQDLLQDQNKFVEDRFKDPSKGDATICSLGKCFTIRFNRLGRDGIVDQQDGDEGIFRRLSTKSYADSAARGCEYVTHWKWYSRQSGVWSPINVDGLQLPLEESYLRNLHPDGATTFPVGPNAVLNTKTWTLSHDGVHDYVRRRPADKPRSSSETANMTPNAPIAGPKSLHTALLNSPQHIWPSKETIRPQIQPLLSIQHLRPSVQLLHPEEPQIHSVESLRYTTQRPTALCTAPISFHTAPRSHHTTEPDTYDRINVEFARGRNNGRTQCELNYSNEDERNFWANNDENYCEDVQGEGMEESQCKLNYSNDDDRNWANNDERNWANNDEHNLANNDERNWANNDEHNWANNDEHNWANNDEHNGANNDESYCEDEEEEEVSRAKRRRTEPLVFVWNANNDMKDKNRNSCNKQKQRKYRNEKHLFYDGRDLDGIAKTGFKAEHLEDGFIRLLESTALCRQSRVLICLVSLGLVGDSSFRRERNKFHSFHDSSEGRYWIRSYKYICPVYLFDFRQQTSIQRDDLSGLTPAEIIRIFK